MIFRSTKTAHIVMSQSLSQHRRFVLITLTYCTFYRVVTKLVTKIYGKSPQLPKKGCDVTCTSILNYIKFVASQHNKIMWKLSSYKLRILDQVCWHKIDSIKFLRPNCNEIFTGMIVAINFFLSKTSNVIFIYAKANYQ